MLFSGDLRRDYELLHMLEKEHREMGRTDQEIAMRRMVRQLKEGIRNCHREKARYDAEEIYKWKTYRDYWDEMYCRIEYEGIPTEEEIKEYIEEEWCHWYNPYDDGRDCTGVWFTSSIRVFPIPALNKTIVYHFKSCDV